MNTDDSLYDIQKGWYIDALNITKNDVSANNDYAATNIVGNRLVDYTLPAGTNITIGAKADVLRNRVFEFIWNSTDFHSIVIYDNVTRTRSKLIENLTDTGDIDVLQFTRYNKIIHVDIIYKGEDEGDLLFWTDGNVSPRKCNVKHIQDGIYTTIKVPFIELAKMPPIQPALAVYGTDATRNANSLRKKLVMITYRWKCDDFEFTTFTTYSKIPLPIGYYGSDNDVDNTKNNFITITVETGDENVTDIEIAVRFNIESNWGDYVLAVSLNKEQLSIADNTTYDYIFYNDGVYPPLDVEEVIQLFDWVPQKAESQCSGNGNTIELAAITEGFDNYNQGELDVTITAENVTNVPPDTDPPAINYIQLGNFFTFTITGNVPVGTLYIITALIPPPPFTQITLAQYTSIGGDTNDTVAAGLYLYITTNHPAYAGGQTTNQIVAIMPATTHVMIHIVAGGAGGGTISTEKVWLHKANYIFGQAYKDEQGRIMPGVTSFINPVDSDNDYLVTTPSFSLNGADVETPVITAEVNHLPMDGAVTFGWTRRRMTYANFVQYETCDYQSDATYLYFCLANIEAYKLINSQFIYGTAPIFPDSRIQIIAGVTAGGYNGDIWDQDYEILGLVTKTLSGGTSPGDDRQFIKVKKPVAAISPAYTANMLVMVYTPMTNPTSISDSVFYEWAEEYAIYTGTDIVYSALTGTFANDEIVTGGTSGATGVIISDDGATQMTLDTILGTFVVGETITGGTSSATSTIDSVDTQRYHRGMTQDQTATQPAIYVWAEGDVYFHQRTMIDNIITAAIDTLNIMDSNWSDFFNSAVNDNGRGLAIEVNGRRTYFPATIRFSLEYQQNTNINQTNRFKYQNFIECDRSFGSILRMSIFDRFIDIGQEFKIGSVPLFNQISKDAGNSTLVASTDILLNPVQYYLGDFGVGNAPGCWTTYNFSRYFFDTRRGIWCRLSRDGIIPISVLYKINSWATEHGTQRTGNFKIYGTYDSVSNNCIFAFEATGTDDAATISFSEENNNFESFLSYHPEMMVTLGKLLITFKNGQLYTHDDTDNYNRFYEVDYPSSITAVFNQNPIIKKSFVALTEQSNTIWEVPEITTQVMSYGSTPQQSNLIDSDFDNEEGQYNAALLQDSNSIDGLIDGEDLKGKFIVIKFYKAVATSLVTLEYAELKSIESALNVK